ncbi:MAG: zinc ribbon domain-containing protein [Clostridiaceae bacterium]|nr:zinc ribbon domain-containing protein [Clostridiaceae bacterium]
MPVLACIGLSILVYFLLLNNIKGAEQNEENTHCNKCNEKIKSTQAFCPNCREKLREICTSCKKTIDINWRYCPYCGDTKENR